MCWSKEESEQPKSITSAAHLACESVTASSSDATVDSKVKCGLAPTTVVDGDCAMLQGILLLLRLGKKILSMPSVPARCNSWLSSV